MKFDVIIGNPPYQEMTGGGTTTESSMPLYHYFIEKAMDICDGYVTMIIPSRWMSGGKSVLDDFRRKMVECGSLQSIYNFEKSQDVFPTVNIAGGIQYLLLNKEYNSDLVEFHNCKLENNQIVCEYTVRNIGDYTYIDSQFKEQYLIVSDNNAKSILDKILVKRELRMDASNVDINPFNLGTDFQDSKVYSENKHIKVVRSNNRVTYTDESNIVKNYRLLNKYKVCVGKLSSEFGGTPQRGKKANVITNPFILGPNEVCTGSFVVIGVFNTLERAENMVTYMKTKFTRYLISVTISGMHISTRNYMFVPIQDYSKPWTDLELYDKYGLSKYEIELIENKIKQME